jgi:hypothetical protein
MARLVRFRSLPCVTPEAHQYIYQFNFRGASAQFPVRPLNRISSRHHHPSSLPYRHQHFAASGSELRKARQWLPRRRRH